MMLKRAAIFFLILATIVVGTACSGSNNAGGELIIDFTAQPTEAVEVTDEPIETITPEPTKELYYSKTTGIGYEQEPVYHPISVMIENHSAARPQTGMQQADIVYEMPVEGGITRMLCIFNDTLPVEVGPVRSTRIYFLHTQREWDSVMVHYGGPSDEGYPSYVYGPETEYIKVRVDGLKGKWNDYFWRSSDREAPHNVYTDLSKINEELYNYTPQYRDQLSFDAAVDISAYADYGKVTLSFQTDDDNHTRFEYNAGDNRIYRYVNGKEFMIRTVTKDEDGNKTTETAQFSCQNLIVQHTKSYVFSNDKSGRRMVEMTGSGKCDYFIGGKHLTGTWARSSLDAATSYFLEDGSLLTLLPGNTWIALQPTSGNVVIE